VPEPGEGAHRAGALPIHIGAVLLGHLNIQTTRGYVAVFHQDVITHYQQFVGRRRQQRPAEEYRAVTDPEWAEFTEHFDRRRVELGSCAHPYGTPCRHEHACLTEMILGSYDAASSLGSSPRVTGGIWLRITSGVSV
jgi:hypothetical protein